MDKYITLLYIWNGLFVLHNISFSRSHHIIWEILGNLLITLNMYERIYNHDINDLYKYNFS